MLKIGDTVRHKDIPESKGVIDKILDKGNGLEAYVDWEQGSLTWLPLEDHELFADFDVDVTSQI